MSSDKLPTLMEFEVIRKLAECNCKKCLVHAQEIHAKHIKNPVYEALPEAQFMSELNNPVPDYAFRAMLRRRLSHLRDKGIDPCSNFQAESKTSGSRPTTTSGTPRSSTTAKGRGAPSKK